MTTAADRRPGVHGSAVRCARAVVVALLAALAVLIHHDTTSMAMPARAAATAMAGMDRTTAAGSTTTTAAGIMRTTAAGTRTTTIVALTTTTTTAAGHGTALHDANLAMDDHGCACSGPAMQHCAAGDVSTAKFTPPPAAVHVSRTDASFVLAGHGLPGTSHRAPPDLSLLSRLLI
ncbi:hypothetical protein [Streptomyces sp. YIM S03343]